jgi:hypothetical protein
MKLRAMLETFSAENYSDSIKQLSTGLENLNFLDNFDCNIVTVKDLVAGALFEVPHGLQRIPKGWLIIRHTGMPAGTGTPPVEDSTKAWTDTKAYFYNGLAGSLAIKQLTILFL